MKKLFLLFVVAMMAVSLMAENYPTKFLGIPIDGTKQEMIKKLQAKGFEYDREGDYLSGEFNGSRVNLFVATNNNKVYRIMVAEEYRCSENQIRIRFNNLMRQFNDNGKYISYEAGQTYIPSDEDISYEMTVHDKLYDAKYVQITHDLDSIALQQDALEILENIHQYLPSKTIEELDAETLSKFCVLEAFIKQYEKNMVWFRIYSMGAEYYLSIYYDNLYNQANGEDL